MNATAKKDMMKNHRAAGLDINAPVIWVNHRGQHVPATVELDGRIWCVSDLEGNILSTGGHGARFTFVY